MLLLPFLTQLFTKKRQTLYDLIVKTIVIKGKFVNGELIETEDAFTKKWLVVLLPIGLLLIPILFIFGIPAYYGYMEAEQNQVAAMQDSTQNQPSEIAEQQSSQSQPIKANENKFIDDNYAIIGKDKNNNNHYIKTYSIKDLDNGKREAIFKLNMPSIDTNSVFNYANEASLQLFKTNWDEMIGVHSSVSASKSLQSDRNKMLKEVARVGFVEDYKGTRMAFDGSLFQINDAIIWNIVDSKNNNQGQAVLIMDHSLYE